MGLLQKIDKSIISQHSCLDFSDHCFFLGEYTVRMGFEYRNPEQEIQNMNDIINNFKKPVNRIDSPEWKYKEQSKSIIVQYLLSLTCWDKIKNATWVPMPSSKTEDDPFYDDRMWDVLKKIKEREPSLDIRKLLLLKTSRDSAHNPGAKRPSVQDHLNNFIVDKSRIAPTPDKIIIFDDVITSGAHYKAAQKMLQKEFSDLPIMGLFVARSVRTNPYQF